MRVKRPDGKSRTGAAVVPFIGPGSSGGQPARRGPLQIALAVDESFFLGRLCAR